MIMSPPRFFNSSQTAKEGLKMKITEKDIGKRVKFKVTACNWVPREEGRPERIKH